ncbi:hypothetical protein CROQUDRAFT_437271 [Cronartium quercuum f. sp. fusiforme G11]|uniref:Uncharacterized protein n=1 Tax=Cronartium quercuum f. sp. fusiforme G11 TaxID=708437 RepID=A0A9P6T5R1_9BASI|nr:hypothetical protein CROQUDRAFT_437271 [Cronartium quercuum f. sp. fusiforme G11]
MVDNFEDKDANRTANDALERFKQGMMFVRRELLLGYLLAIKRQFQGQVSRCLWLPTKPTLVHPSVDFS